jgi:rubrerythrin
MHAPEIHGIEVEGVTRGSFILRGALAAGAVYGTGAVAPFVSRAFAAVPTGDIAIVGFALAVENLEAAMYQAGAARAGLTGQAKKLTDEFASHETQHVQALTGFLQALGGKPPPVQRFKFPFTDQASFLKLAVTLEEVGIGAYNGAAPAITSPDVISAAGAIVQTEARHAGALRMLTGQDPAPQAFDKPLALQEVTARVKPYVG